MVIPLIRNCKTFVLCFFGPPFVTREVTEPLFKAVLSSFSLISNYIVYFWLSLYWSEFFCQEQSLFVQSSIFWQYSSMISKRTLSWINEKDLLQNEKRFFQVDKKKIIFILTSFRQLILWWDSRTLGLFFFGPYFFFSRISRSLIKSSLVLFFFDK